MESLSKMRAMAIEIAYGPCWESNVVTNGQQLIPKKQCGSAAVRVIRVGNRSGKLFLLVEW